MGDCWGWQGRRRGKGTSGYTGLVKREKRDPSENGDVAHAVLYCLEWWLASV